MLAVRRIPMTEGERELIQALVSIFNMTDGAKDASAPSLETKVRFIRRIASRALEIPEDKGF